MVDKKTADLVLRAGLGLFLVVFGIGKFVSGIPSANMMLGMMGMTFLTGAVVMYLVGIVEILAGLGLIVNKYVKYSSGIGALAMLVGIIATIKMVVTPFGMTEGMPPHILLFGSIPLLGTFLYVYWTSKN